MNKEIEKAIEVLKCFYKCVRVKADGVYETDEFIKARELAITALEAQQAEAWIPVSERLPQCEYGYESKQVLYQMKNTGTIESGYYGCGGKIRDKYFRHLRDSSEGVDVFDVIAWKYPTPYKEEQI